MKKVFIGLMLALTLIATPAMAKDGLFIGAFWIPSISSQGDDGSGYGFRAGFGFGKYLSILGQIEKSTIDVAGGGDYDVSGLAVDLRVNFPLTTLDSAKVMSFEPYVQLGYGITYEAKWNGGSADGSGKRIGIGVEQYLFRELSINVGWTSTTVKFGNPVNEDFVFRSIDVGINYHFL